MSDLPISNIFSEVEEKFKYRIYLTDVFEDDRSHIEAIELIRAIEEKDEVHLYITSPGGLVSVADMYIAAINDCKGHVVTHGVGGVASAAVILFLAGDERICTPGSSYMLHNVQYGVEGDSANIKRHVDFYHRLFREKFYDTYREILTDQEMEELFDRAGEIYLTAEEMEERLDRNVSDDIKIQIVKSDKGEYGTVIHQGGYITGPGYTLGQDSAWQVVAEYKSGSEEKSKGQKYIELGDKAEDITVTGETPEERKNSLKEIIENQKETSEGAYDDKFSITLDCGFSKDFVLSKLSEKDFDEYNMKEIFEICEAFDLDIGDEPNRKVVLQRLISHILKEDA